MRLFGICIALGTIPLFASGRMCNPASRSGQLTTTSSLPSSSSFLSSSTSDTTAGVTTTADIETSATGVSSTTTIDGTTAASTTKASSATTDSLTTTESTTSTESSTTTTTDDSASTSATTSITETTSTTLDTSGTAASTSATSTETASSISTATSTFSFTVTATNSANEDANGQQWETGGEGDQVVLNSDAGFNPALFYLEQPTNYLMSDGWYIAYESDSNTLVLASPGDISSTTTYIVCNDAVVGDPLSCKPIGFQSATQFLVSSSLETQILVELVVPGSNTNDVTADMIVGAAPYVPPTFNIKGANSNNVNVDGQLLQASPPMSALVFDPGTDFYDPGTFSLEATTNYLMVFIYYVVYWPNAQDPNSIYTATASQVTADNLVQLVCNPLVAGEALSCTLDGSSSTIQFYVSSTPGGFIPALTTNSGNEGSVVPVDLIVEASSQ